MWFLSKEVEVLSTVFQAKDHCLIVAIKARHGITTNLTLTWQHAFKLSGVDVDKGSINDVINVDAGSKHFDSRGLNTKVSFKGILTAFAIIVLDLCWPLQSVWICLLDC